MATSPKFAFGLPKSVLELLSDKIRQIRAKEKQEVNTRD
jgi:hypothetical protein